MLKPQLSLPIHVHLGQIMRTNYTQSDCLEFLLQFMHNAEKLLRIEESF